MWEKFKWGQKWYKLNLVILLGSESFRFNQRKIHVFNCIIFNIIRETIYFYKKCLLVSSAARPKHNKPNIEEFLILGLPERRFIFGPAYLPERRPAPSVTRPSESQHCPALSLSVSSSLSCTCCWTADRIRKHQPLPGLIRPPGWHLWLFIGLGLWIRVMDHLVIKMRLGI